MTPMSHMMKHHQHLNTPG